MIYSCVQNNSSVFKKASKAQNPYNFYFNTHKCIGNIAHFILNQNMKKIFANLLLLYRKWRKRNIRLFKKIAVSAFVFTKSNIYCINRKMLEDLAFLWMTELTFSCIAMVSENCFTSVLHGVWHLVNRYSSPGQLHYILQFLCISWFCLRNSIFDVTPQVFYWIKVWRLSWPLHNVNLVGLEPRCCSLTGVFGVVVLLEHPFPGHFLFGIRQNNLFKYLNVLKLIHDPWNAINTPNVVWETSPYHDACATMLHCLNSVLWLEFSVWGSSDKLSAALRPKKNNLASSVHKILRHFSLDQSMCSLANCNLFIFFNNGTLRGLLAYSLASHRRLLIVTVLTGNFRLSLITLELIIGWVFAILAILRSIRMIVFHFLPHLSGFGCYFKAFDIILAEQPIIFCTSLYVLPSLINFLIKVSYSFEQCLERPILLRFSERNAQYNICCLHP